MQLFIDTTKYGQASFVLSVPGKRVIKKTFRVLPQDSSKIIQNLDSFLKQAKIKNPAKEILSIVVYKGGGSFTGLRIAAAVAQALVLAWGAPLKFIAKNQTIPAAGKA